jgi:hypothetical protein
MDSSQAVMFVVYAICPRHIIERLLSGEDGGSRHYPAHG